jgi:hypothetical protein
MNWLWPIVTGVTFIDVWTLPHLGFWVVVGSTCWAFKLEKYWSFGISLVAAFAWEGFEKVAETRWPERWQDPESFINSAISDPLTCVIGFWGIWWLLNRRRRRGQ